MAPFTASQIGKLFSKLLFTLGLVGCLTLMILNPSLGLEPNLNLGTVTLTSASDSHQLGLHLSWLADPERNLHIEDVSQPPWSDRFEASQEKVLNWGFAEPGYWVRFTLINNSTEDSWLLLNKQAFLDKVDLYSPTAQGGFDLIEGGDLLPFSERRIQHAKMLYRVDIAPGESQTFYMYFENEGRVLADLSLWSPDTFLKWAQKYNFAQGLMYGVLFYIVIYSLVLFFQVREKLYLAHALWGIVGGVVLFGFEGLGYQFLWPNWTYLNDQIPKSGVGVSTIILVGSYLNFLDVRRKQPRTFKLGLAILLGLSGLSLMIWVTNNSQLTSILLGLIPLTSLFALWFTGRSAYLGHKNGWYYFVLLFLAHLAFLPVLVSAFDLIPISNIDNIPLYLSISALFPLLALITAKQLRKHQQGRIKAEVEARKQAEINQKLVEARNQHLENTVSAQDKALGQQIAAHSETKVKLQRRESEFRAILDELPIPVGISNPDKQIVYLNQAFSHLFGYTLHDFTTVSEWNAKAYPDPEYRQELLTTWKASLRNLSPENPRTPGLMAWVTDKHGKEHYVQILTAKVGAELVSSFADYSTQYQLEEELRQREAFLRSIYNTIPLPIFIIDVLPNEEYRLGPVNPAHETLTGLSNEETQGRRIEDISALSPESLALVKAYYKQCLQEKRTIRYEAELTINGQKHWWLNQLTPLYNEAGEIVQLLGSSQNINTMKAAETSLQNAKEAAERANRAKSVFLNNISHELRTPLNGIMSYLQILQQDNRLTSEQLRALRIIEDNSNTLLKLINDLLDITQAEVGQARLNPKSFRLDILLADLTKMAKKRAEEKNLQFESSLGADLPQQVWGDDKCLWQVLLHLLNNALKFTRKGQITLTVVKEAQKIDFAVSDNDLIGWAYLRFGISDTGIGIDEALLEQIFKPFEQLNQKVYQTQGTGLGLTISRDLVQLMGGTLQVESTWGVGSHFWFEIVLPELKLESVAEAQPVTVEAELVETPEAGEAVSKTELELVYRLLLGGDILAVQTQLEEIGETLPDNAFIARLTQLAHRFELESLQNLLEKILSE